MLLYLSILYIHRNQNSPCKTAAITPPPVTIYFKIYLAHYFFLYIAADRRCAEISAARAEVASPISVCRPPHLSFIDVLLQLSRRKVATPRARRDVPGARLAPNTAGLAASSTPRAVTY